MGSSSTSTKTSLAFRRPLRGALSGLPVGGFLSPESWRSRHRWICRLLWTHVLVLSVYGIVRGEGLVHSLLEGVGLLGGLALVASSRELEDSLRSLAATLGLASSSAVLVHFSGGLIEMHFHFFVVVLVVSLYQSWRPFLVALVVVLLHHGVAGMIDPTSVYNHPAALARPWLWALIHAGFILAASVACLVSWRLNEDSLERERRAHDALAAAQQIAGVGSWEWDLVNDVISWSDQLYRLLDVDPAISLTLETFLGRVHPDDRERIASLIEDSVESATDLDYECRVLLPDGVTRIIRALGTLVAGPHGSPEEMRGTCQDVTERKALEQEIEYRAFYDSLTGLANRALFMDRLDHAVAVHDRTGVPAAVLYVDLDGFKTVNDRHGHDAGDQLLREAGRRLQRCIRAGDTPARLGGDEFAIILPEADLADAELTADRVHRALAEPLIIGDEPQVVTASIGIAEANEGHHAPAELLRRADVAMYAAKAAGKARHRTYTPGIERAGNTTVPDVALVDARAWAGYMRQLRLEIADRKLSGHISAKSRAPDGVHRTLEQVLAAIDQLASDSSTAPLVLPPLKDLEEFLFHQTAVQHWADALAEQGTLTATRTAQADRFWNHLERHTAPTPASDLVPR